MITVSERFIEYVANRFIKNATKSEQQGKDAFYKYLRQHIINLYSDFLEEYHVLRKSEKMFYIPFIGGYKCSPSIETQKQISDRRESMKRITEFLKGL